MYSFILLAAIAITAFLIAWIVNGLVGLMTGERPRDTYGLWFDTFLKFFAILELGLIGRILNNVGFERLSRKAVLFIGLLCALLFLLKACRHVRQDNTIRTYKYPIESLNVTNRGTTE